MTTTSFNKGTGALRDREDLRDFKWSEIGKSVAPYDWTKPFDIETIVGKLKVKDQDGSSSCGGQAWSYYGEVLSAINDKVYTPKSAKFIYSQTYVQGGGSAGRDNCNIVIKQGWADEAVLPSYDNGQPPSEPFMERSQDLTQPVRDNALKDEALSYAFVNIDIDSIAQAIQANNGCILGVVGENNGTWLSAYPKPPQTKDTWAHWLYFSKVKMENGKKYIGCINSWGVNVGEAGWQWLGEDYIHSPNIFSAWTLTYNVNSMKISLLTRLVNLYKQLLAVLTGR